MMIKLLFLLLVSVNVFADTPKLHIQGNKGPVLYLINDNILKYNIESHPSGQSKTLLQHIANNKDSFGFANSANLFLENDPKQVLKDIKIIAALVNLDLNIAKKTGHSLNKDKLLAGGVGKYAFCRYVVDYYAKKNNIQYKYISYNSSELKDLDLLAERLDIACMGNRILIDNKSTEVIYDFYKDGFKFTLFLLANKNISKEKEKEALSLLKNANTADMHKLFKDKGFELLLETEEKKDITFNQQREFWTKMKGNL
jgi:hypothetical protein